MRAASSGQPLHRLARKLSSKSEVTASQPGQSLPGTLGTVQSVNGDGTATVVYMGASIPCQLLGDFVPVVGQGVLVLIEGERNWCIGPAATIDQTWQSLANLGYASGWSDLASGGAALGGYRIVGDIVELRGIVAGPSSTGTTAIFTLPFAPQGEQFFPCVLTPGGFAAVFVSTAGAVAPGISVNATGGLDLSTIRFSVS